MNKEEALKILTNYDQSVLDSIYPFQVNKIWKEAYDIAVNNLRKEVEKEWNKAGKKKQN